MITPARVPAPDARNTVSVGLSPSVLPTEPSAAPSHSGIVGGVIVGTAGAALAATGGLPGTWADGTCAQTPLAEISSKKQIADVLVALIVKLLTTSSQWAYWISAQSLPKRYSDQWHRPSACSRNRQDEAYRASRTR